MQYAWYRAGRAPAAAGAAGPMTLRMMHNHCLLSCLLALLLHSALGAACPLARNQTDQRGGKVLCGLSPNFITTESDDACCGVCFADASPGRACQNSAKSNAWVRQPSTGHCWCIKGATTAHPRLLALSSPLLLSPPPSASSSS